MKYSIDVYVSDEYDELTVENDGVIVVFHLTEGHNGSLERVIEKEEVKSRAMVDEICEWVDGKFVKEGKLVVE